MSVFFVFGAGVSEANEKFHGRRKERLNMRHLERNAMELIDPFTY